MIGRPLTLLLLLLLLIGVGVPALAVGPMEEDGSNDNGLGMSESPNSPTDENNGEGSSGSSNIDNEGPCASDVLTQEQKNECIDLTSKSRNNGNDEDGDDDNDNNQESSSSDNSNNNNDNNNNDNENDNKANCPTSTADEDGTTTTVNCDGTTELEYADGSTTKTYSNDSYVINSTHRINGVVSNYYNDGSHVISYPKNYTNDPPLSQTDWRTIPDGTIIMTNYSEVTPKNLRPLTIIAKPDGTEITDTPQDHWYITFPERPDGTTKVYFENGTNVIVDKSGNEIKRFND